MIRIVAFLLALLLAPLTARGNTFDTYVIDTYAPTDYWSLSANANDQGSAGINGSAPARSPTASRSPPTSAASCPARRRAISPSVRRSRPVPRCASGRSSKPRRTATRLPNIWSTRPGASRTPSTCTSPTAGAAANSTSSSSSAAATPSPALRGWSTTARGILLSSSVGAAPAPAGSTASRSRRSPALSTRRRPRPTPSATRPAPTPCSARWVRSCTGSGARCSRRGRSTPSRNAG